MVSAKAKPSLVFLPSSSIHFLRAAVVSKAENNGKQPYFTHVYIHNVVLRHLQCSRRSCLSTNIEVLVVQIVVIKVCVAKKQRSRTSIKHFVGYF